MSKKCFDCRKTLTWTGTGPSFLNREQWEAQKAGDYYAPCDKATHNNGNCYFWDNGNGNTLKKHGVHK